MDKILFTSESVGAGHPDKICDQISDLILDRVIRMDKEARVAVEVMASNRLIVIGGEITTSAYVDFTAAAWDVLMNLGYSENDFTVISNINKQSADISKGVHLEGGEIGAGDQGIIFGYASNETKEYMPLPIMIAHKLVKLAEKLRLNGEFKYAKSDMKSQVTIDYTDSGNLKIDTILMSIQHDKNYNKEDFFNFIKKEIMIVIAKEFSLNLDFKILINPTGNFVIGGPIGDTGLTGRKIIVDTYGGMARHGGGAFSGKDYTKVDRSAAYAARWVAKNLVAAGVADKLEIQISYAIGMVKPVSIYVDSFNTSKIDNNKIIKIISEVFDLTPTGIIDGLKLKRPIYHQVATYGHFGREDVNIPWEGLDKVSQIKKLM